LYIPEFNRVEDRAVAVDFMRANPFAILVSNIDGSPFATHLPLLVDEIGSEVIVRGHMAKANPHWKSMLPGQESLVIFHGPHAYISPSLYEIHESVPTWNYAAVHVYGTMTLFTDEPHLYETLNAMIHTFEAAYMTQWNSLGDDYQRRMLKHIVGFEMKVQRLEAKFKLSQNRTRTEQAQVIECLKRSPDSAVSGTADLMQKQKLGR